MIRLTRCMILLWGLLSSRALAADGFLHTVGPYKPHCLAFAADSKTLAVGTPGAVDIWDVPANKRVASLPCNNQTVFTVAFSPKGDKIAAGTVPLEKNVNASEERSSIYVWEAKGYRQLANVALRDDSLVEVAFLGGDRLVAGCKGLTMYRLPHMSRRTPLIAAAPFALSANGVTMAASDGRNGLAVSDFATSRELMTIKAGVLCDWVHPKPLSIAPDGSMIAVAAGKDVILYKLPSGEKLTLAQPIQDDVGVVGFAGAGNRLAIAGRGGSVVVWDVAKNRVDKKITVKAPLALDAVFTNDGKRLTVATAYYLAGGPNDFGGIIEWFDLP